jgi:prepilin-type processing-associated H-X9-DG protein
MKDIVKGILIFFAGMMAIIIVPFLIPRDTSRDNTPLKRTQNHLLQILYAILSFEKTYGRFPGMICDPEGRALLSWRVKILPFIEEETLYQQFHRDEPWDSPHNLKLLDKMPRYFGSDQVSEAPATHTHFRIFLSSSRHDLRSPDAPPFSLFDPPLGPKRLRLCDIGDGPENTLAIVEAKEAVPWTMPEGLEFPREGPLPKLADFWPDGKANVGFFDGSFELLSINIPESELIKLITPNGGEQLTRPRKRR